MSPDVADVAEVTEELTHDRLGTPAIRALEVAVLDHCHRSVERPADAIAFRVDVDVEVDERLGGAQEGTNPKAARKQSSGAKEQPGEDRRAECGAQDAQLRLLELGTVEGERRDEQRDGEADPGDRAAPGHSRPAHRRAEPSAAQSGEQPRASEDPHRLAGDVADEDPERDRRAEAPRQEAAVDRDPGVREREQRHDHVARPGVKQLLQPFVERRRGPDLHSGHACQLRGGLLPELSEPFCRSFETGARSRVGVNEEPHREADDDRLDARLEQGHPGGGPKDRADEPPLDPEATRDEDGREEPDGGEERQDAKRLGVDGRDDDERDDVVHHDDREHERPQPIGKTRADERQQAEREGRVGRHGDPPAARGRAAGVEGEIDADGRRHPADPGQQRQREPPPLPQLAQVELPPRLEADDEEEERHQPAVHPVAKIQRDP